MEPARPCSGDGIPTRATDRPSPYDDRVKGSHIPWEPAPRREPTARQITAWNLANLSYRVSDGSSLRAQALELYEQEMHDRIVVLFARSDAQNCAIEAALASIAG